MRRWYAVQTKPHQETWAMNNLIERGLEVYLPRYAKRRRHARRVEMVKAAFFPGYLFVRVDFDMISSRAISMAPGVVRIVAFGAERAPVRDRIIAALRAREDERGLIRMRADDFAAGETVRVEDGAFGDQVGLCCGVRDGERVMVLFQLLGRAVRATVPANALRPALA